MSEAKEVYIAVGRRKSASARIRLIPGTGKVTVNKRAFDEYFPLEQVRGYAVKPLDLVGKLSDFDVVANITGGGVIGQAGAMRHGIARALEKFDAELRPTLKAAGMMTRDSREKERKKPGRPGARKRFQFSKR